MTPLGVTGREAEALLDDVGITVNKNAIPFDVNPPNIASGIRIGTPGHHDPRHGPRRDAPDRRLDRGGHPRAATTSRVHERIRGGVRELVSPASPCPACRATGPDQADAADPRARRDPPAPRRGLRRRRAARAGPHAARPPDRHPARQHRPARRTAGQRRTRAARRRRGRRDRLPRRVDRRASCSTARPATWTSRARWGSRSSWGSSPAASSPRSLGVLDDTFQLRARWQLLGQLFVAGIAVVAGITIYVPEQPGRARASSSWPSRSPIGFTILWIVGMINSINFIDGLDGLSSGIALIAAVDPRADLPHHRRRPAVHRASCASPSPARCWASCAGTSTRRRSSSAPVA